jgi:hypothetical protein
VSHQWRGVAVDEQGPTSQPVFDTTFVNEVKDLAPLVKRVPSHKRNMTSKPSSRNLRTPQHAREHDASASKAVSGRADLPLPKFLSYRVPGPAQAPADAVKYSSGRPERSVVPTTHAEEEDSDTDVPIVCLFDQRHARFATKKMTGATKKACSDCVLRHMTMGRIPNVLSKYGGWLPKHRDSHAMTGSAGLFNSVLPTDPVRNCWGVSCGCRL